MSDNAPDTVAPKVEPKAEPSAGLRSAAEPAAATSPVAAKPVASATKIGVLLVNLGTPDTADVAGVRRYLKEFLSDTRVIEKQGLPWRMLLKGVILPLRPRAKARDYQRIWNTEQNESPLKTFTRAQAHKLAPALALFGVQITVDWAMRYGNPSIASRVQELAGNGCERILVMPLYPQYSAATTATACDEVFRALMAMRRQPTVRVAAPYFDDPVYVEAVASSARAEIAKLTFEPEVILASFHGMPQNYIDKGDPYYDHCVTTTRLLREALKMDESKLVLTFQSRFGRGRWLEPATIDTVRALAKRGVKSIAVVTPGFASDCLETLEEIAVENANMFRRSGGENFAALPCLNDSEPGMLALRRIALRELRGWV
jgi:protoporphyrin/coproporphyrin ferrochelatase